MASVKYMHLWQYSISEARNFGCYCCSYCPRIYHSYWCFAYGYIWYQIAAEHVNKGCTYPEVSLLNEWLLVSIWPCIWTREISTPYDHEYIPINYCPNMTIWINLSSCRWNQDVARNIVLALLCSYLFQTPIQLKNQHCDTHFEPVRILPRVNSKMMTDGIHSEKLNHVDPLYHQEHEGRHQSCPFLTSYTDMWSIYIYR